ncbi:MAG: acyltransferase domain-containing protein, partial [bacterium]|nr:acyltransferase domain-containing protein [bacterium]
MNDKPNKSAYTGLEIAVIGMAGRFPGARNLEEFQQKLVDGTDCITFFEDDELLETGTPQEILDHPNYVKAKGIVEDVDCFDSSFFKYNSIEAELMDPQIRIFHECAWEALENTGIDPAVYKGLIGLYAGYTPNLTWKVGGMLNIQSTSEHMEAETLNSNFFSTLICYKLNLKGPGITMNTACSTSLVAVHMACRALLTGEADMVMAGGVTVTLPSKSGYMYQEGLINSPDGHCRAFDVQARGTISGNGVGVVVLKRLVKAQKDGDYIHAIIKGSAINNDGNRKAGYTAPSVDAQAEAIRMAMRLAKVKPETIGYMESHGTATPLGDPIEMEALKRAFKTEKKQFCRLGALKANIGHLDAAAGVAGFIKTVLVLEHKMVPPHIYFNTPSPALDFANSPFRINTEAEPWETTGTAPRRAGVSSFGIGGTNAHVVLEEAPQRKQPAKGRDFLLFPFSAKSESALEKITANLREYLIKQQAQTPKTTEGAALNPEDIAYTLQTGRGAFTHRRMMVCKGNEMNTIIDNLAPDSGETRDFITEDKDRPVIFMFPGLGTQYVNMGRELYQKEPLFRETMDRCFDILKSRAACDIRDILYPNEESGADENTASRIHHSEFSQPAVFAVEYALATLLMQWGIQPHAMIGYSFGEYVAACISGVFSLEDALTLVAARSKLIGGLEGGAMMSVPMTGAEIAPFLGEELAVAIDNGDSCIISGPHGVMDALEKKMKEQRKLCFPLQVSHAIHSPMMAPIIDTFEAEVRKVTLSEPRIPYISNATGTWITAEDAVNPRYWAEHLQHTVQFADGLKEIINTENALLLEVGPGVVLSTMAAPLLHKDSDRRAINTMRSPEQKISDREYLLNKIGRMWLYGKDVDWSGFYGEEKRCRVPLPTYPFEKKRFGITAKIPEAVMQAIQSGDAAEASPSQDDNQEKAPFYIPSWQFTPPVPMSCATPVPCPTLVFADDCGITDGLVKILEAEGFDIIRVKKSTQYEAVHGNRFRLDAGNAGHYRRLFKDLKEAGRPPERVIHAWSLTGCENENDTVALENINTFQAAGFHSLVHIAGAVDMPENEKKLPIMVVSNHIHSVYGNEYLNPLKSTVSAAVKLLPQLYPHLNCRIVDICTLNGKQAASANGTPGTIAVGPVNRLTTQLAAEFILTYVENETEIPREIMSPVVALRGGKRLSRKLEPGVIDGEIRETTFGQAGPRRLKQGGVYLVTNGISGVALMLAETLARNLDARLVLLNPQGFPAPDTWEQAVGQSA